MDNTIQHPRSVYACICVYVYTVSEIFHNWRALYCFFSKLQNILVCALSHFRYSVNTKHTHKHMRKSFANAALYYLLNHLHSNIYTQTDRTHFIETCTRFMIHLTFSICQTIEAFFLILKPNLLAADTIWECFYSVYGRRDSIEIIEKSVEIWITKTYVDVFECIGDICMPWKKICSFEFGR